MSYLHSHVILHRIFKADTFCIDDRLFPKIAGLHLCRRISTDIMRDRLNSTFVFILYLGNARVCMNCCDLTYFTKERRIGRCRYSGVYEIVYQDQRGIRYEPFSAKTYTDTLDDMNDLHSQEAVMNSQLNHPCVSRFICYRQISFDGKKHQVFVASQAHFAEMKEITFSKMEFHEKPHHRLWNCSLNVVLALTVTLSTAI